MTQKIKNNVHVSGKLTNEQKLNNIIRLTLNCSPTPIIAEVSLKQWENFRRDYPDVIDLSVSGILKKEKSENNFQYVVKVVNDNSICCHHNLLGDSLENEVRFSGLLAIKKKFDYDTDEKMYLKRIIFSSDEISNLEMVALRTIAPYFDNIKEGEHIFLEANYVPANKVGFQPYWRITHKPVISLQI